MDYEFYDSSNEFDTNTNIIEDLLKLDPEAAAQFEDEDEESDADMGFSMLDLGKFGNEHFLFLQLP